MNTSSIVRVGSFKELLKYLHSPSKKVLELVEIEEFVNSFIDFFRKAVGNDPWNLQVSWAFRIAQKSSFAMIAPTGVGKTTFGLVMALFLAYKHNRKAYIIVPTSILVEHYYKRLQELANNLGIVVEAIAMHSKVSPKRKAELEEIIKDGKFDILITTSNYLQRNFDRIFKHLVDKGFAFDFIFVDDVDAIMKGSKAIEYVLMLLGFSQEDIQIGYKLSALRIRQMRCLSQKEKTEECREDGVPIDELVKRYQAHITSKRRQAGILIVSSATGRARGRRIRLFKELLGFTIGSSVELYRNIADVYVSVSSYEQAVEVLANTIKRLGPGGLVFVPLDKGVEEAQKLAQELVSRGIKADVVVSKKSKSLKEFIEGNLDVVVGVATYYGLLVRGIDLPEVIRYAIFFGVPRHKISLSRIEYSPTTLLRVLSVLLEVVDESERNNVMNRIMVLRRIVRRVSPIILKEVVESIEKGVHDEKRSELVKTLIETHDYVSSLLKQSEIIERLKNNPSIVIYEEGAQLYMLLPDAPTYIQASGRTSRLYIGGITRGLSIVISDDPRLVNGLEKRLRFYIDDFKFYPINEVDIEKEKQRIDEDRKIVKMIKSGSIPSNLLTKVEELTKTALFIVESPNKARTIASFFGRPTARDYGVLRVYEVDVGRLHLLITASGGHIFELVEEELSQDSVYGVEKRVQGGTKFFVPRYDYIKRCLVCGTQFVKGDKCPVCGSSEFKSSKDVVEALQRIALEVDEVIIATDPDSEGEKIAYDIAVALAPYAKTIKRAEFHEVTRRAVLQALENLRGINLALVEAQIARRIEDRWLGFSLSEYVTKLYSSMSKAMALDKRYSAGRVQTPVLGRIIETAINRLNTLRRSKIISVSNLQFEIPLEAFKKLGIDQTVRASDITVVFHYKHSHQDIIYPPPPFTTDEMLAEAQRILRMNSVEAMQIAQNLFELGFITYHRTDSTRVSTTGIGVAKEYLTTQFGDKISEVFALRSWGEGGAHEAIRPTRPVDATRLRELIIEGVIETPTPLTSKHYKLYDLIFRRFIASQMKPAVVEKSLYTVEILYKENKIWETVIEVPTNIIEPGFLLYYSTISTVPLPRSDVVLRPSKVKSVELSDVKLPTQGDIVRWMKNVGIGRPSTYAKIIDTIQRRRYVYVIGKNQYLIPSLTGILIYSLLAGNNFPDSKHDVVAFIQKFIHRYPFLFRDVKEEDVEKMIRASIERAVADIAEMVSTSRTKLLYEKMEKIEKGEIDYTLVINELFNEVCSKIVPKIYDTELDKVKSICS